MANKDRVNVEKVNQEIQKIEAEYSEAQNRVQSILGQMSSNQVVKRIWEESNNGSQAFNTSNSVNNVATLQLAPRQSGGRTEGMTTNIQQKQVIESQARGIVYPLSEASPDRDIDPVLDMWKQLKCVTICMFSGDKRT